METASATSPPPPRAAHGSSTAPRAGSPSGLGSTPVLTLTGPIDASNWGRLVGAGDVNGDGHDNIVLVADQYANIGTGKIYLYTGSPTGPGSSPDWSYSFTGNRRLISPLAAGDVNGDGYADIAVLVRITNINQSDSTAAVLFFAGSPWDARDDAGVRVTAGLYIIRATTAGRSEIQRLVVLR